MIIIVIIIIIEGFYGVILIPSLNLFFKTVDSASATDRMTGDSVGLLFYLIKGQLACLNRHTCYLTFGSHESACPTSFAKKESDYVKLWSTCCCVKLFHTVHLVDKHPLLNPPPLFSLTSQLSSFVNRRSALSTSFSNRCANFLS